MFQWIFSPFFLGWHLQKIKVISHIAIERVARRLLCHSYNLFLSFLISLCRTPPFLTALTIHKGLKIGILKFFLNFSIFGPISKCVSNCPILPNFFQFCRFCPILSNFIQYFRFCPIAILQFCHFRLFCPVLSILSY